MIKLKDLINENINEGKSDRNVVQNFLDKVKKETGLSGYGSSSGNMPATIPWSNDPKKEKKIMKIAKDMGFKLDGKNNQMLSFYKMAESIEESSFVIKEGNHKTYFHSFSGAATEAAKMAEKQGYTIDEDDWFSQVATGGRYSRSRPSVGETHRFTVGLEKRGKKANKALHFQVYGMQNGKYELNAYVN